MGVDRATADLLHSAVHNLKGPASRLRLLAQLLARSGAPLDQDSRVLLKHMEDSAGAVGVTADGLATYAEICARPWQPESVDLGSLLGAAIDELRSQIERAGAQVTHSPLPTVLADRFLVTWLWRELLANAIRFRSQSPPEVRISSAAGGPANWYVAVSDNGTGIEPSLAERVFLPFKKLSAAGGAGLGLTICRKIVELHDGKIWLEPRAGGAEFRFYLGGEVEHA